MRLLLLRLLFLLCFVSSAALAQWPSLAEPLPRQGDSDKDAALIISLETYAFLPGIPGAGENAAAWFQHLVKTRGVPVTQVRWLQNTEAALESMRKELKATVAKVKPGGVLWVVFIGHGAPSEDGSDGLLVGADAQNVMESFAARSLKRSELLSLLESGQQSTSVVLLDACFSGQSPTGQLLVKGAMPTLPEREAQFSSKKPVLLLSAGTSRQVAGALPGKDVPAFSYLALGGLRGWADEDHDGKVTAGEVVGFARSVMGTTVTGRTQTPTLNPESAVNVVVGKAKAGEELPLSDVVLWLKGASGRAPSTAVEPPPEVRRTGPKVSSGSVKAAVGVLSIATKPNGARLDLVDPSGAKVATKSPYLNDQAAVGRWTITASKDGLADEVSEVAVVADDTAQVLLSLKKPASLEVTGTPAGALVRVTGPGFSNEGGLPWRGAGLVAGSYQVKVMRDGYIAFEWSGSLEPGKEERLLAVLARAEVRKPKEPDDAELKKKDASSASDKSLAGEISRAKKQEDAPSLTYDAFRVAVEVQVSEKRRSQIADLTKVIELSTDKKEKPGLLLRLGELYSEESRAYFFEASRKDDDKIRAVNAKDEVGIARAEAEKAELMVKSKEFADRAAEKFVQIVAEYRDYERTDEVLYLLGLNLMADEQNHKRALASFKRLIEKYPKSKHLPDAYLSVGEYYFSNSRGRQDMLEKALENYKNAAKFPETRVYDYALYKQGWCYFAMGAYDSAMDQFKSVVLNPEPSGSEEGLGNSKRNRLVREARTDYVRAFARGGGTPNEAKEKFSRLAKNADDLLLMTKLLANLYHEDSKDKEAGGSAGNDAKDDLGEGDILEVVSANKGALSRCAEEQRKREPGTTGRLVIKWTIQTSGKVSNVDVVSEEFKSTYMASCVNGVIKSMSFPRHKKQGAPVQFPFKF